MLDAIVLHSFDGRKKKLKTFLDYPLYVQGLTKGSLKKQVSSSIPTPPVKTTQSVASAGQKNTEIVRPASPKVASTAVKGRRKSIIRIKPQTKEEVKKEQIYHGDQPFSSEQITQLWKKYSDAKKKTLGGFSSSILSNTEPKLLPDNKTIHLVFRNETNELEFGKLSLELLEFLKSNLKNNHISFSTEISVEKAKKLLYTNRDKFNHFTEKHPKLLEWEEKLGLELK